MKQLAENQEPILFDLDIFKGFLYKDILTVEKDIYTKKYHRQIFSD